MKESTQNFFLNYDPHGPQKLFSDAIVRGAKVVLFLGGIRSGKSYGGIAEVFKQIYQYDSKPRLGWVISPTYKMAQVTERLFRQMCVARGGSLILSEKKSLHEFTMRPSKAHAKDGDLYKVQFMSADDPDKLRGASVSWVLLDEAAFMKPDIWTVIRGRVMDNGGLIMITTTPKNKNWLYENVFMKGLDDPRYAVIRCKTRDNPYLPPEEVEILHEEYTQQSVTLAKREMDAEFVDFEGLVFDNFDRSRNIINYSDVPDIRDAKVFCGIDWGYNDPFVCVWIAKIDGTFVVMDEYYKPRMDMEAHAVYLKSHPLAPYVSSYWCDPSGKQERVEMAKYGVHTRPARRPDRAGRTAWNVMRARLMNKKFGTERKVWDGHIGAELMFSDRVKWGVREMMSLCYKNSMEADDETGSVKAYNTNGAEIFRNASEQIVDFNNHFTDAMGYAMFSEARPQGGYKAHYEEPNGRVVTQAPKTHREQAVEEIKARFKEAERSEREKPFTNNWDTMKGLTDPQ